MPHDLPSPLARVSIPTTLPPAWVRGTHRKATSWCAQCSSLQSGGRLLAGTAPGPEVQRNRDTAGCKLNKKVAFQPGEQRLRRCTRAVVAYDRYDQSRI